MMASRSCNLRGIVYSPRMTTAVSAGVFEVEGR